MRWRAIVLAFLGVSALASDAAAQSDVAFPKQVYSERRARLALAVSDAVIIVPGRYSVGEGGLFKQDANFWYLTGVESSYAILVLATPHLPPNAKTNPEPRAVLFLPEREQFAGAQYPMVDERFRRAAWNRPVRRLVPGVAAAESTGIAEVYPLDEFAARLKQIAEGRATVYFPLDDAAIYAPPGMRAPLTMRQQFARSIGELLPGRKMEDLTPVLRRMRLVKDQHEIAALRRAAEISVAGMLAALREARPGMNDREVAGLMEYVWKREGSPRASFAPIVASGPSAMTLFTLMAENYNAVDRTMRAGDLLFIDYGAAEFMTYAADLCRTLPVSGKFTAEQRKYYDIVLEAQEAAIAAIRPGVMMLDVIKAAAAVFRQHGLEPYEDVARMGADKVWGIMPSPTHYLTRNAGFVRYSAQGMGVRDLGHSIGLEVTDGRDWSRPLEPGMVVTIEPKLYIPEKNIAIMIEDMILVTPTGHENLSAALPKKAEEVERVMAEGRKERRDSARMRLQPGTESRKQ